MRNRTSRVCLAVLCLLVAAVPAAVAGSDTDRATGGGQVLVGTKGAGDTIAFSARGTADSASGQIQYVDRSAGNGQDQVVTHGTISCLDVDDNMAKASGTFRDGTTFQLFVQDNGEGKAADSDMIFLETVEGMPDCDFDEPSDDDLMALARGNAQVYDADA